MESTVLPWFYIAFHLIYGTVLNQTQIVVLCFTSTTLYKVTYLANWPRQKSCLYGEKYLRQTCLKTNHRLLICGIHLLLCQKFYCVKMIITANGIKLTASYCPVALILPNCSQMYEVQRRQALRWIEYAKIGRSVWKRASTS